jgi:hypothetical protein
VSTLWHVRIDDADWDYDRFSEALVWAETPEQAEQIMRREVWHSNGPGHERLWIDNPDWRLHVQPAKADGVALVHWRAG